MCIFGQGDSPPLAEADFFAYRILAPAAAAVTVARLDTGDPWLVLHRWGQGRVIVVSTPIDAEAGTLPVNPDFVPLAHEWIVYLAGGGGPPIVRPGEPLHFTLAPRLVIDRNELAIETPSQALARARVETRQSTAEARFDDTSEAGGFTVSFFRTRPAGSCTRP